MPFQSQMNHWFVSKCTMVCRFRVRWVIDLYQNALWYAVSESDESLICIKCTMVCRFRVRWITDLYQNAPWYAVSGSDESLICIKCTMVCRFRVRWVIDLYQNALWYVVSEPGESLICIKMHYGMPFQSQVNHWFVSKCTMVCRFRVRWIIDLYQNALWYAVSEAGESLICIKMHYVMPFQSQVNHWFVSKCTMVCRFRVRWIIDLYQNALWYGVSESDESLICIKMHYDMPFQSQMSHWFVSKCTMVCRFRVRWVIDFIKMHYGYAVSVSDESLICIKMHYGMPFQCQMNHWVVSKCTMICRFRVRWIIDLYQNAPWYAFSDESLIYIKMHYDMPFQSQVNHWFVSKCTMVCRFRVRWIIDLYQNALWYAVSESGESLICIKMHHGMPFQRTVN